MTVLHDPTRTSRGMSVKGGITSHHTSTTALPVMLPRRVCADAWAVLLPLLLLLDQLPCRRRSQPARMLVPVLLPQLLLLLLPAADPLSTCC